MNFSQFGGGSAVTASDSVGTWTTNYTISAGNIDNMNNNVLVTATWNNTAGGDNNADTISSVTVNFGAFGGSATVPSTVFAEDDQYTGTVTWNGNPRSSLEAQLTPPPSL